MLFDPIMIATILGTIGMFVSEVTIFTKRYSR
jgi:hypothetical protein